MIPDGDSPHHGRNQSIALLGIGTALIGFGLFSTELRGVAETIDLIGVWRGLLRSVLSYLLMTIAGMSYLSLVGSVHELLTRDNVRGKDVARGPMRHLIYLATAVVIGFFLSFQ